MKEKYIGESGVTSVPKKKITFRLGEKVVKEENIATEAVTIDKLGEDVLLAMKKSEEGGGIALSKELGNSELKGITQKKITEEIHAVNDRIDNIDPESFVTVRYKTTYPEVPSQPEVGDYWIYDNTLNVCTKASEYDGQGWTTPEWELVTPSTNKLYLYNNIIFRYVNGTFMQVGEQGPQGETGATGPIGPKGDKGNPGTTLEEPIEVFNALSDLENATSEEKEIMIPNGKAVEELNTFIFGGGITLENIAQHTGFVSNGNVAGTAHGWWSTLSGWSSRIYDVTAYAGKTLSVTGAYRPQSYRYIFCKDYTTIPANQAAYEADPTLWTSNMVACNSARGSSGNNRYANPELAIPVLPEGTEHLYMILAQYSAYTASAVAGIIGALDEKQDKLVFDIEPVENSYNPVTSDGIYRMVHPVAQEVLGNDGSIGVLDIIRGKLINSNSTNIGYWASYNGYNSYVFDVSNRVGQQVKVRLKRHANTIMYAFVRNYEDITDSLDSAAWAANRVSSKKASPNSTSTGYVEYTLTVPLEAVHLVLSGTDSLPGMCIYPEDAEMGLEEIREVVEDLVGNVGTIEALNPSKEYLPKIKQMVHQRYSASGSPKWKTTPLLLAHFSDVHANGAALSRMLGWCSQYNDIADILHTGDAVSETLDDGMAFWDNAGAENVLNIVGNHDASLEGAPTQGTAPVADIYNVLFAPYVDNWDVIQPEGAEENGLMYWYKDYATNKVRLIGLDCMHRTSAQLTWLQNVLVNAANNGLTVVIAYHTGHSASETYTKMTDCNFCDSYVSENSVGTYVWPDMEALVTAFKAGTLDGGQETPGDFACWLCGHSHRDYVLWTESNQLVIGIDAMTTGISGRTHAIRNGEKSQDLFNLVAIDTYWKTVKLLRVGSDTDDQLRHIGQCAIKYETGQVISQW